MTFSKSRVDDSRSRVREMLNAALGVYIKAEPKQRDQWRDQSFNGVWAHLLHEVEEVKRSGSVERKLHNLLDLCGQAAICAAHIQLYSEDVELSLDKR